MKNQQPFLTASVFALSLFALPVISHAETAAEIATRYDREKIAEIQTYLEENPKAEDLDNALSILISSNLAIGEFTPVPDLLQRRYEAQPKGPEANLQVIVNEIARPYIETSIVSDQRDKAKAFVTQLKSDFAESPESMQLNQFLDQLASNLYLPGVGDEMTFAFTDLGGNEVDLAAMADKVVLIDFWATWCGPCVAEMPSVISTYEEFHEKGFEIVGISLDEDEGALKRFVEENGMEWPQYFDGKGWQNELAQRFGIGSIPATFLVGKGGKVIASNLRGEQLREAVSDALGEG